MTNEINLINTGILHNDIKNWCREDISWVYNKRGVTLEESEVMLCFEIFRTIKNNVKDEALLSVLEDKFDSLIGMIKDTNTFCIEQETKELDQL